jgi:hypothetical protein
LRKKTGKPSSAIFATTYGSDIQNLVSGAQSLTKLVTPA